MCGQQPRAAFTKRQCLVSAALHLAHKEDPETDQEEEGRPRDECCQPRALTRLFAGDLNLLVAKHIDEFRVIHRHHGFEGFTRTIKVSRDVGIGNRDVFDVATLYFLKETTEGKDLSTTG